MLNLVHAELFKLLKGKAIKVSFIVSLAASAILMTVSHMLAEGKFEVKDLASASAFTEVMILSLLSALMIAMIVCNDFETKTIHDSIVSGNGRKNIIISKIISFTIVVVFITLPYLITTLVCYSMNAKFQGGFVLSSFLNILLDNGDPTVTGFIKIIFIGLIQGVLFSSRMTILLPISFKIKNPIVVTAIGFALSGVVDFLISIITKVKVMEKIIAFTPFCRKYLLVSLNTSSGTLIKSLFAAIAFMIIMGLITYRVFRRAEIK